MPVYNSSHTGAEHDEQFIDIAALQAKVTALESFQNNIFNTIYPVGSIYTSVNSTSPATLFGGTWEQIKDKFILCCGDNYANGATGGEATHTLTTSEMPSHGHSTGSYSIASNGAHGHNLYGACPSFGNASAVASANWWAVSLGGWTKGDAIVSGGSHSHSLSGTSGSVGDGGAHNNMPPYLACYVWQRTA